MTQVLNLETLLKVPYVEPYTGFDFSPDGTQVAFSWNPTGRWEIYVVSLDGSAELAEVGSASPRQITTGPGGKFAPRWSPGGQCLAYVLDLEGGELYDIYVYDLATGQHSNLTPDTPDAIQPNFGWSPDGRWIAFASDRSGRFDTYVIETADRDRDRTAHAKGRPVLSLPYPDWEVHWSPDGRWLAVVAETHGQDYGIFVVPVASEPDKPAYVPIADAGGPICAMDPCWSLDSRRIAFAGRRQAGRGQATPLPHGYFDIGIYELATGQITWVTGGEGDKTSPIWSPDGRRLAYVASDGPVTSLAVLELGRNPVFGKNRVSTYQVEPGVYYQPRFTPDGTHLAFVFDNPCHPGDLWLLSLADGSFQQLTHSLPPELQDAPFTMPTQVRYPSLDGQCVPALLYQPRQAEGLPPAVVYIHGGPNWLTQVTWDPLVQHMVGRGWAVLAPNYRGSTGYGRDWQLANRFDLGGGDTQDVVAGADYLVAEGLADPARIAVTGRSWGGYLTMTSLTHYPERWAAGSAVVPFLNWFTAHANSREDLQHWDLENFGDPQENYDLWYERSPFFFLDRITAPVQLICGAHDVRCPASESVQARDALLAQGKPCDLILYPDEGHSFLKTENVVDAEKRRVSFLAETLERKR
jgi:dipeptidyl aminopeptidase/acylaminoacyl peptidase